MRLKLVLILVTLMMFQASGAVQDEIHLKFRQAQIGDEYRFWNGEGYLSTSAEKELVLYKGSAEVRWYSSSLIPQEEDEEKIVFAQRSPGDVEIAFLLPEPKGHGYYSIGVDLPRVNDKRHLTVDIENGARIISSSPPMSQSGGGNYLTLEGDTDDTRLRIVYLTDLANRIFTSGLAASIFMGFLLVYLIFRRPQVSRSLKTKVRVAKSEVGLPLTLETSDRGYKITYLSKIRAQAKDSVEGGEQAQDESPQSSDAGEKDRNLSLVIPHWLISSALVIFLLYIFAKSIFVPLDPIIAFIGPLKYAVYAAAAVYALLSALFIISAGSDRDMAARVGIVGGGIIGMLFGYLGWIAVLLTVTTALLIYLLSILVLEEGEDEASSDDPGL